MSDNESQRTNGASNIGHREGSQAPPSPYLRKHDEKDEVRQRIVTTKVSPDREMRQSDSDENNLISSTMSTSGSPESKTSSGKTWPQYVKEDKERELKQQSGSTLAPCSSGNISTEIKNFWVKHKIICVVAALMVLVGILAIGFVPGLSQNNNIVVNTRVIRSWNSSRNFLLNQIRSMMNKFPAQKQETWIQLLSAVNSTLSDQEPKQPAAIVILVPPDVTPAFATCFVKTLAETVNNAHIYRHMTKHQTKRVAVTKEMDSEYFARSDSITDIHDDLKNYLVQDKAVIFYDVDRVQREDQLMIFHGFCDSSQAYDKRATYFFVISVPKHVHQETEWTHFKGEEIAQRILNNAWDEVLSEDKRPAVISRILANIVLINYGDSCK